MKRGDIVFADLSPTVGSEINKRRPVLIVSTDANNRAGATITVLPITSNVDKIYPFEVFLRPEQSGLPKASKAQTQQIRTISKQRIRGNVRGHLSASIMDEVDATLRLHLDIH